jgi:hypothetical protein
MNLNEKFLEKEAEENRDLLLKYKINEKDGRREIKIDNNCK